LKIDRAEIYLVRMPLIYPWRTAYGEDASIDSVLVKLVAGGQYSWGETTPLTAPFYSPEWSAGAFQLISEHLARRVVGEDIRDSVDLLDRIAGFKGNGFAKSGLELAWWVLDAKSRGRPLHEILGGTKAEISVGADFGVQDTVKILLTKIQGAIDQGYPRVKLKFRRGWDLDMLRAVRDAYPRYTFHIDCNAGYALADIELFKKVDRFELAMIEQPLNHTDLLDHAELQKQIETPICLDESITTPKAMVDAIELRSCRFVNIKAGRVGGLTNAIKIHDLCEGAGIPCWVGGMLESGIGSGISIELATLSNFKYPADIFPAQVLYRVDLALPEVLLSSPGKVRTSTVPGTPYEPNPEMLERCTLAHSTIKGPP
jgi:o-succinylbenzoate synthase